MSFLCVWPKSSLEADIHKRATEQKTEHGFLSLLLRCRDRTHSHKLTSADAVCVAWQVPPDVSMVERAVLDLNQRDCSTVTFGSMCFGKCNMESRTCGKAKTWMPTHYWRCGVSHRTTLGGMTRCLNVLVRTARSRPWTSWAHCIPKAAPRDNKRKVSLYNAHVMWSGTGKGGVESLVSRAA